jgi:hypothetical protein
MLGRCPPLLSRANNWNVSYLGASRSPCRSAAHAPAAWMFGHQQRNLLLADVAGGSARFEAIADPSIPQRGRAGADATVLDQRPRPEIADSQTAVPTAEVLYCHLRRADLLRHLQNVVPGMAGPDIGHAGIRCGEACPSESKIAVVGEPRRRRVTEADFAAGAIAWPADRGHRFFTVERRLVGEIDYVSRNRLLPVPRLPNRRHGGMRYKRALRTRR